MPTTPENSDDQKFRPHFGTNDPVRPADASTAPQPMGPESASGASARHADEAGSAPGIPVNPAAQPAYPQPHYQQPQGQQPHYQQPPGQQPHYQQPQGEASAPTQTLQMQPGQQAPYGQAPYGQAPYGQASYGQTPSGQDQYGQPVYGAPRKPPVSPLAIVAIVAGGLALLLCWLPYAAWGLGLVAIVCGVIALAKKMGGKGLSIAGIALGAVGALLGGVIFFIALSIMNAATEFERSYDATRSAAAETRSANAASRSAAAASRSAKANAEHTIEYKVTSNAPAKVSYRDASGTFDEEISAPWTKTFTDKGSYISGRVSVEIPDYKNKDAAVTCEILIDGKSVSKKSGKGAGAYASCSGTLD